MWCPHSLSSKREQILAYSWQTGDSMGFLMDGLEAEAYDRKYTDRALLARIIGYFRPRQGLMAFVALLVVLNSLVDTAFPLLVSRGLDLLIASKTLQTVTVLIAAILAAGILSWTFNFFRQRFTARSVGDVVLGLRKDAFAAIVARDMSFYDEFPSGKIVSRVTSDTEDFATIVTLSMNLLSQFLLFFLLVGVLFFRNVYLALLWFRFTSIASFWSQFHLGLSASERVFAFLDAEPRVHQVASEPVEQLRGKIEFRNLFFSYDDRQSVLTNFNLTIQPGETVAIVGHTGAGKSSLAKLIARFYEYQGVELLIDVCDIRSFDLHAFHRQLCILPQSPPLFSGTVTENIRYARPSASDEKVEAIARSIGHGDWLEALPDGLNTLVGEAGRALSMGQRQLVALARVLLQDPAIIILDEATASVDPLTEAQIQEGLDLILKNRTSILIAHRLSTIQHADRILVLAN